MNARDRVPWAAWLKFISTIRLSQHHSSDCFLSRSPSTSVSQQKNGMAQQATIQQAVVQPVIDLDDDDVDLTTQTATEMTT